MKKVIGLILIGFFALAGFYFFSKNQKMPENPSVQKNVPGGVAISDDIEKNNSEDINGSSLVVPLDRAKERVSKKPFAIFITRENSPVQPERFSGHHTGVDFEIFADELNRDVPVRAVCGGIILRKGRVNGYGGTLVQSCIIDNDSVTVLYGHLDLKSISKKIGEDLQSGEVFGNLGSGGSVETDGERKHLHIGIHKGEDVDFSGYVGDKKQLSNWIDICPYICK